MLGHKLITKQTGEAGLPCNKARDQPITVHTVQYSSIKEAFRDTNSINRGGVGLRWRDK